jgi:hypothetical protein
LLLHVGRPLWLEEGSVLCSVVTHWSESRRTHKHILLSHLRHPQSGGSGPRIYIPQKQGGPVIPPGTEFPFVTLTTRRATVEVFYPASTRVFKAKIKSKLYYDRRSVGQSLLVSGTQLETTTNFLPSFLIIFIHWFVDVGCPLWREVGPVVFSCYWASQSMEIYIVGSSYPSNGHVTGCMVLTACPLHAGYKLCLFSEPEAEGFRSSSTGLNCATSRDTSFHILYMFIINKSLALVPERTIPTERPPPVGEVSANFCGLRDVA